MRKMRSPFVVVDDNEAHLRAIVEAFRHDGISCLGVRYDPASDPDPASFRGVRALFLDLHLTQGVPGSGSRGHYAALTEFLNRSLPADGGPFVLVVWTEHPEQVDQLVEYLDEEGSLDAAAKPAGITHLDKQKFLDPEGALLNPPRLLEHINAAIDGNPQLKALLAWESDVLAAADATLRALAALVPPTERSSGRFAQGLDVVLSGLATAAVGKKNVLADPRSAISKLLAPILADSIVNQPLTDEDRELWGKAVTLRSSRSFPPTDGGAGINQMLHLALPASENILPTDWGCVVDCEDARIDDSMAGLFELSWSDFLTRELKIPAASHARCYPVLVRIGAPCDFAQPRKGPLTYLLGAEVPLDIEQETTASPAVWESPVFRLRDPAEPAFRVLVNARFPRTSTRKTAEAWSVRYRFREQLLMHLLAHGAGHAARPGLITL